MMMALVTNNTRFLGIDLKLLSADLGGAWRHVQSGSALGWFVPSIPVRLLRADGREAVWMTVGANVEKEAGLRTTANFLAVELPEEYLLVRTLVLPTLTRLEIAQAVQLDAEAASPFPLDDLVWGHSSKAGGTGMVQILVAMASRSQVLTYLERAAARLSSTPEVWALADGFPPVVFEDFGKARRMARVALRQRISIGLLLSAIALAICIGATPVLQLRFRAMEAVSASDALIKRAEPLLRQRAVLTRAVEAVAASRVVLSERSDPLYVMDLLTTVLPDDTSLLGLQILGSKVTINGLTSNTAALMQQLGSRAELRDVKAPTAATRAPGSPKDVFNIEFTLTDRPAVDVSRSAGAQGPATTVVSVPVPASAASASIGQPVASTAPATLSSTVARSGPPPASPAPAVPTPAPAPAPGGASFGGAVFGAPPPPPAPSPKAAR